MTDIIDYIAGHVESVSCDDSLASLLTEVIKEQTNLDPIPQNYFYVTHIINPAQTFFAKLHPDVRKPPELARKLARGKQLHNFVPWIKTLPNYVVGEGSIDGIWVDIKGVRGKIDHRIGDSIIELKTKANIPETATDVIINFPQDVEQLLFYSVMHPLKPSINYLVFMKSSAPFEMKAFKVVTKDHGTVMSVLKTRIATLRKALENKDPSHIGRCRYYERNCQFRGVCSCGDLKPIDITALMRSADIEFDKDFTEKLDEFKKKYKGDAFRVSIYNIIAPRKRFVENTPDSDSNYKVDDTKAEYGACFSSSLYLLKNKLQINLTQAERKTVTDSLIESRFDPGFNWLKLKSANHPDGEIVPYITKVNMSSYMPSKPHDYHIAELGILCAAYGKSSGLILMPYPNLNKLVRIFQVTYRNTGEILGTVRKVIDSLQKAEKEGNLLSLPSCLDFMCNDGKCAFMKECHPEE